MPVTIPQGLLSQRDLGADWSRWLDRLPRLTDELVADWHLTPTGAPLHGSCSLVVPVTDADGAAAALKISFDGDDESLHEGLALQHWGGRGAVRLMRADPRRRALLLERLHPEDLATVGYQDAAEVVAGLYGRIHLPALPQLRTVTSYVGGWLDDLATLGRDA
ncbi:MAG: aminoglycoside phosphotransferase family protein, partial [Nocardioides sp.]